MTRTCACIICDGEPASSEVLKEFVQSCSLIIAADGGIGQLKQIGIVPDLLIGDMLVRKADGGRRPRTIWEIPD